MDTQHPEDGPLASRSRAGSEEPLVAHAVPAGGSNRRAFKVAGLTTLACLLVASQVFTAYMMVSQKQQIRNLEKSSEQMTKDMTRATRVASPKMHMSTFPLLMDNLLDDDSKASKTPLTKLAATAVVTVEKQLTEFLGNSELPKFNHTFQTNLLDLQEQMDETEWKSFTTWLRYWLIFQMAQKKPPAPPTALPAFLIKTKCQMEAEGGSKGLLGSYKPQCDEEGKYKSSQCSHSTGWCWCVDEQGALITGSETRGRPQCEKGLPRMAISPRMMMSSPNDN